MAKSIAEKLSNTLESLAELRIATGVGDFKLDISQDAGGMKVRPSQTTLGKGVSPGRSPSSLSDLGMIYCGGGKRGSFSAPFRQIAPTILLK
mgnify:CR=1 FL=1